MNGCCTDRLVISLMWFRFEDKCFFYEFMYTHLCPFCNAIQDQAVRRWMDGNIHSSLLRFAWHFIGCVYLILKKAEITFGALCWTFQNQKDLESMSPASELPLRQNFPCFLALKSYFLRNTSPCSILPSITCPRNAYGRFTWASLTNTQAEKRFIFPSRKKLTQQKLKGVRY